MSAYALQLLFELVLKLDGRVDSVRFMKDGEDVDYACSADEVEVILLNRAGNERSYFILSLPDGDEWVETA